MICRASSGIRVFTEAIQSAGLSIDDSIIRWYDSYDLERLVQAHDTRFLQDMIRHSLNGCTAVVCYNDQIAYYLLQELRLRGFLIRRIWRWSPSTTPTSAVQIYFP